MERNHHISQPILDLKNPKFSKSNPFLLFCIGHRRQWLKDYLTLLALKQEGRPQRRFTSFLRWFSGGCRKWGSKMQEPMVARVMSSTYSITFNLEYIKRLLPQPPPPPPLLIRLGETACSTKYVYIKSITVYVHSSELESQFRRLEKKLRTLPTLWRVMSVPLRHYGLH